MHADAVTLLRAAISLTSFLSEPDRKLITRVPRGRFGYHSLRDTAEYQR